MAFETQITANTQSLERGREQDINKAPKNQTETSVDSVKKLLENQDNYHLLSVLSQINADDIGNFLPLLLPKLAFLPGAIQNLIQDKLAQMTPEKLRVQLVSLGDVDPTILSSIKSKFLDSLFTAFRETREKVENTPHASTVEKANVIQYVQNSEGTTRELQEQINRAPEELKGLII